MSSLYHVKIDENVSGETTFIFPENREILKVNF